MVVNDNSGGKNISTIFMFQHGISGTEGGSVRRKKKKQIGKNALRGKGERVQRKVLGGRTVLRKKLSSPRKNRKNGFVPGASNEEY